MEYVIKKFQTIIVSTFTFIDFLEFEKYTYEMMQKGYHLNGVDINTGNFIFKLKEIKEDE